MSLNRVTVRLTDKDKDIINDIINNNININSISDAVRYSLRQCSRDHNNIYDKKLTCTFYVQMIEVLNSIDDDSNVEKANRVLEDYICQMSK